MGYKKYYVRYMLKNLVYDLIRMQNEGMSQKQIFECLEKKIKQIRKMEKSNYIKLVWE